MTKWVWVICGLVAFLGMAGCQTIQEEKLRFEEENPQLSADPSCRVAGNVLVGSGSHFWENVYHKCPISPYAAYRLSSELLAEGKFEKALKIVKNASGRHPDFQPLTDLLAMLNTTFQRVSDLATSRLKSWLKRPSEVLPLASQPPEKPDMPTLPKMVKGEFETTHQFKKRVRETRETRKVQIAEIENRYKTEVAYFNNAVSEYNKALRREPQQRRIAIPKMRERFLTEAMNQVLGAPVLKNLKYDADSGLFYGRLVATHGNFDRSVTIKVPIGHARAFKEGPMPREPKLRFTLKNERLRVTGIDVGLGRQNFAGTFTDKTFQPVVMTASVDVVQPRLQALPTLRTGTLEAASLLKENDEYFNMALSMEENPELAKLRQQKAELRSQQRNAKMRKARKAEINQLRESISKQQAQLADMDTPEGDQYKGLRKKRQWNFRRSRKSNKEMLAVIIGNRNYQEGIPLVHYAHNDAKAMKHFVEEALGVPSENVLFELDATKGILEGLFKSKLPNLIDRGSTDVLVYFSGHGMPTDQDAYLLPTDAHPETVKVTGYSRDLMIQQLASLDAKSVTVILDACFTGRGKSGAALLNAKSVLPEPKTARVSAQGLLISASGPNQVSWMDDASGMSLLTLHLLEGLSDKADRDKNKNVTSLELQGYLQKHVDRAARRLHKNRQVPEVIGAERVLVAY